MLIVNYSSSSNSDWEEELEETAVAIFLNESISNQKLWVRPINAERNEKRVFLNLFYGMECKKCAKVINR